MHTVMLQSVRTELTATQTLPFLPWQPLYLPTEPTVIHGWPG